jgi:hypothetical protein
LDFFLYNIKLENDKLVLWERDRLKRYDNFSNKLTEIVKEVPLTNDF